MDSMRHKIGNPYAIIWCIVTSEVPTVSGLIRILKLFVTSSKKLSHLSPLDMLDYERYDHTYCRILKDGDEVSNRKRRISNASYDKASEPEVTLEDSVPAKSEKENGSAASREPVIIVRTKRPRKTTPVAVDHTPAGSQLLDNNPVLPSAKNDHNTTSATAKADVTRPKNSKNTSAKSKPSKKVDANQKDSPVTVGNNSDPVLTSFSGRRRKLTPKAKENIEAPVTKSSQKQGRGKKASNGDAGATPDAQIKAVESKQKKPTSIKKRNRIDSDTSKVKAKVKVVKSKPATSKQKNKLIVVMKPSSRKGKTISTPEKTARGSRSKMKQGNIPAAQIDVGNIVSGSRRPRR